MLVKDRVLVKGQLTGSETAQIYGQHGAPVRGYLQPERMWPSLGSNGATQMLLQCILLDVPVCSHVGMTYCLPMLDAKVDAAAQAEDGTTPEFPLRGDASSELAKKLVSEYVEEHPGEFPFDIAVALGLPPDMVDEVVDELLAEGTVRWRDLAGESDE